MKTEKEIIQWIEDLQTEQKLSIRDEIDKENIQAEIDILKEVLK